MFINDVLRNSTWDYIHSFPPTKKWSLLPAAIGPTRQHQINRPSDATMVAVLDLIHRTVVTGLFGVTVVGVGFLGVVASGASERKKVCRLPIGSPLAR